MAKRSVDFFFNKPEFIRRRKNDRVLSFPLHSTQPLIYFTHSDNRLISVDRSTFGGFVMSDQTTQAELDQTITEAVQWARNNGIGSVTIRCFPEDYCKEESTMSRQSLDKVGFKILYQDITQIIPVTSNDLIMNVHRRRRLRQCRANRYRFEKLGLDKISEAYPLFEMSRKSKGYPVTMSLNDFQESFQMFPQNYLLFGVRDKERIIASCVCIHVSESILYCFYIGDDLEYRKWSPVTMLLHGLYFYAQRNNYQVIDLGISTDKGILNEGLHDFKKSFGAYDNEKLTYQLTL